MISTVQEPPYMKSLRDLVKGDGLDLEVIRVDPVSGSLYLKLSSGPNVCQACVMSVDFLIEIALPLVRRVAPSIRRIVIDDQRRSTHE